jgi:hypothetical protein
VAKATKDASRGENYKHFIPEHKNARSSIQMEIENSSTKSKMKCLHMIAHWRLKG